MATSKRFGGQGISAKQLRDINQSIEQVQKNVNDLSMADTSIGDLHVNQVVYKDPDTNTFSTTNAFYYDGDKVGIHTIPSSAIFDVSGYTSFRGNVHIDGSLTVIGTTTTVNTNEVELSNNYLYLNMGMGEITPPSTLTSGFAIYRGLEPYYLFEFSEDNDVFMTGISGDTLNAVVERDLTFNDRTVPIWSASNSTRGQLTFHPSFRMTTSGNLGIGVQTLSDINERLVIEDTNSTMVLYDSTGSSLNIELIRGNRLFGGDTQTDWRMRSAGGIFSVQAGHSIYGTVSNILSCIPDNNGNVGIGIIPNQVNNLKLDINGHTRIEGSLGIGKIATTSYSLDVNGITYLRDTLFCKRRITCDEQITAGTSIHIDTNYSLSVMKNMKVFDPDFGPVTIDLIRGTDYGDDYRNDWRLKNEGGIFSINAKQNNIEYTDALLIHFYSTESELKTYGHFKNILSVGSIPDTNYGLTLNGSMKLSNGSYSSFTGSHIVYTRDTNISSSQDVCGRLVVVHEAIPSSTSTTETKVFVELSSVTNDPRVFGVIQRVYNRSHVVVNSVGEGAIWVTDENGDISAGDYITTSSVDGYGMRQSTSTRTNYTVARALQDCTFDDTQVFPTYIYNEGTDTWDQTGGTTPAYQTRTLGIFGDINAAFLPCVYCCG